MAAPKADDKQRVDPLDIDLSGFEPTPTIPAKPKVEKEVVRQISEANNFPSRAPAQKPKPATPRPARRRRTGRNVQINIKATPETIARFTALADKHKLVFGELLDRALDALEQSTAQKAGEGAPQRSAL
jgi:hypothetical protein